MRILSLLLLALVCVGAHAQPANDTSGPDLFDRENLVAWCIVPFDGKKRGPEARAEMLSRMGIIKLAYDWRAEHIPTFDEEIETLARYGITLQSFWFPGALNDDAKAILAALKRHDVTTELWITMNGGSVECTDEEQRARVRDHARTVKPIAEAAAAQGCSVGLYNHGGWFGEPRNQIEIIHALAEEGITNVGLVYNQHHGHEHVEGFGRLLKDMLPYLYCINLNGMEVDGDTTGKKIWPLGSGSLDKQLLRVIAESGYTGPIGILNHTDRDAETVLLDNLDGLEWIVPQLEGAKPEGPRPPLRTEEQSGAVGVPSVSEAFGLALSGGIIEPGHDDHRAAPITVACWVRLNSAEGYNILIASDTKASGQHWELFTAPGTGYLTAYVPGSDPDHLRSTHSVTDGQWHHIVFQYDVKEMALVVDGQRVAHQEYARRELHPKAGGLGIGRLVSGQLFCDGDIDDVHILRGIHSIPFEETPATATIDTILLENFDDLSAKIGRADLAIEDPARRVALAPYQVIPAAPVDRLTPASRAPNSYYETWTRSHGDAHNSRYASTTQLTPENVKKLAPAWTYHSGDGAGNIQCNPIVVDGLVIAPTSGGHVVGIDAVTGEERWRFKPEGRPAHRGLTYWPGDGDARGRVIFPSGPHVYALDGETGKPRNDFGGEGRITPGASVVAPAVYRDTLIVPSLDGPVWGFDVGTGALRWTFDTKPTGDAFAADTWSGVDEGANCWGGMALDQERGIAYISTGSPKPNFSGNTHQGQNLFANCVLALKASTGEYLWHFQEIRHDVWDLDIPAPPTLLSIDWKGRRVDVVAQVTKLGNTLALDRVTGEPLFPFRMRRAPVSKLPGERTWPYQPDPELPEPFARQVFTHDDITTRTPEARAFVEERIAGANMGWFEPYEENVATAFYGLHGGAEWTGAAVDAANSRLYVSANNVPWFVTVFQRDPVVHEAGAPKTKGRLVYEAHCMTCHGPDRVGIGMAPPLHGLAKRLNDDEAHALLREGRNAMPAIAETVTDAELAALVDYLFLWDGTLEPKPTSGPPRYTHNGYPKLVDDEGYPGCKPPWGTLNCINLSTGKIEWQVPLGVYPELAAWGEDHTGAENFGGATVTAGGLVFCAGTPDNRIRAFAATTGELLWQHELPYGGYAPPTVYEIDGRAFLLIAATGGGKLGTETGDAYVAFALP